MATQKIKNQRVAAIELKKYEKQISIAILIAITIIMLIVMHGNLIK